MGSNGPNIPLVCLAAANAPPSWSFVPMVVKGVLAPAPADSTIGRRCGADMALASPRTTPCSTCSTLPGNKMRLTALPLGGEDEGAPGGEGHRLLGRGD